MEANSQTGLLVPYGIMEEQSDIRAHVGMYARKVYVFKTSAGVKAIKDNGHRLKLAFAGQNGVNGYTGAGYPVPISWINDVRTINPETWDGWLQFNERMDESARGKLAVACVVWCMKRGRFPIWMDAAEDERENVQVKGTDIVIFCRKKIQVKCDRKAGCGHPLCTGNVFLQIAERNPNRKH